MNEIKDQVLKLTVAYVEQTLGVTLSPVPWQSEKPLPSYLTNAYALYETPLLDTTQLLVFSQRDDETPPGKLEKQLRKLEPYSPNAYIYIQETITSYNRRRLIERKIPFIVPGRQLYLPHLGVDLREHFSTRSQPKSTLSPSAQALFLYMIYHQKDVYFPSGIADDLGYSAMSMTRAFDEIEALGIGKPEGSAGKYRTLQVEESSRELWEAARDALRDPAIKRFFARVGGEVPTTLAGVSALAQYTMIAEPTHRTIALTSSEWKRLEQQANIVEVQTPDDGDIEVELWRYDPTLFIQDHVVDPLSLYLSLKDDPDERIQKELPKLLERALWPTA